MIEGSYEIKLCLPNKYIIKKLIGVCLVSNKDNYRKYINCRKI